MPGHTSHITNREHFKQFAALYVREEDWKNAKSVDEPEPESESEIRARPGPVSLRLLTATLLRPKSD